jgi:hypothetical protein
MSDLAAYLGLVERLGPEGVLELAATELTEDEYRTLGRRVARPRTVERCGAMGRAALSCSSRQARARSFVPAAWRRRAKRISVGGSYRFRGTAAT